MRLDLRVLAAVDINSLNDLSYIRIDGKGLARGATRGTLTSSVRHGSPIAAGV
jgi:hypothetical protein